MLGADGGSNNIVKLSNAELMKSGHLSTISVRFLLLKITLDMVVIYYLIITAASTE